MDKVHSLRLEKEISGGRVFFKESMLLLADEVVLV